MTGASPQRAVRRGPSPVVVVLVISVLVVIGGPITLFAMFVLAFAADACGANGGRQPICSGTAQTLVFLAPAAAWLLGLAFAVVGALFRDSAGRFRWRWLAAGAYLPIATIAAAFVLATWGT